MSSSKMPQIYVGLGAIAVVGGLLYMQHKKDADITNTAFTSGSKSSAPAWKIVPDEIDKLTIKARDKAEVVIEKKDGVWAMTSPVAGAKLNKSTVDDILKGLSTLTFKEDIAHGAQNYASYDLEDGKAIHVVAGKGGAVVGDLYIGSQKSRGQLVRVGGSEEIWSVTGMSAWTFDKGPKDIRDKKVWDLVRDNVTAAELHDDKGTFAFTKQDAPANDAPDAGPKPKAVWTGTFDGKPIEGFDSAKVDEFVLAYSLGGVLNAEDFGDGKSDVETGLASPDVATMTFHTKEGGVQRIVLGKSDGTRRYARKEGDTTTYLLAEGPSGWANAGPDKFVASAKPAGSAAPSASAPHIKPITLPPPKR